MNQPATSSLDELVAYAVLRVTEAGEDCTFERLVYECFTCFPEAFGLRRYPEWPDSARVNKAWLRARTDKGWLVGSVQEGFRLTETGLRVARRIGRVVDAGKTPVARESAGRSRERFESLVRNVRRDALFRKFEMEGRDFAPTEQDFRRFLGATLETPLRILRQNLNAYLNAATVYEDEPVVDFLRACEDRMAAVLGIVKERGNGGGGTD